MSWKDYLELSARKRDLAWREILKGNLILDQLPGSMAGDHREVKHTDAAKKDDKRSAVWDWARTQTMGEMVARVKAHLARYELKNHREITPRLIRLAAFTSSTARRRNLECSRQSDPNHVFPDRWSRWEISRRLPCILRRSEIEFNTAKPQYIETIWGVGYRFKV